MRGSQAVLLTVLSSPETCHHEHDTTNTIIDLAPEPPRHLAKQAFSHRWRYRAVFGRKHFRAMHLRHQHSHIPQHVPAVVTVKGIGEHRPRMTP